MHALMVISVKSVIKIDIWGKGENAAIKITNLFITNLIMSVRSLQHIRFKGSLNKPTCEQCS